MHYDYLIVTEKLFHANSGICVANHCDLSDVQQTVYMPDLHTTAYTETGSTLPEGAGLITVTDRVYYENLVPGTSYTIVGNLQYAVTDADGNVIESGPLVQNGQEVKAEITFTPTESSGYVELTFTVDVTDILAKHYNKIVAFEEMYVGPGIRVAIHADINDEEQTVTPPDMHTTALGVNGRHNVAATNNVTINDVVSYTGLTPGREYRLETDLMSSKTGTSIAHVTTIFTPETPDGTITVSLTFDATGYTNGDRVVVFEDLYDSPTGIHIKSHMDWDDTEQTVTFGTPSTGVFDVNANKFLYAAIACFAALIGLGGYTMIQRRRRKNEGYSDGVEG